VRHTANTQENSSMDLSVSDVGEFSGDCLVCQGLKGTESRVIHWRMLP